MPGKTDVHEGDEIQFVRVVFPGVGWGIALGKVGEMI